MFGPQPIISQVIGKSIKKLHMTSIDNVCGIIGILFETTLEGRHDKFVTRMWIYTKDL